MPASATIDEPRSPAAALGDPQVARALEAYRAAEESLRSLTLEAVALDALERLLTPEERARLAAISAQTDDRRRELGDAARHLDELVGEALGTKLRRKAHTMPAPPPVLEKEKPVRMTKPAPAKRNADRRDPCRVTGCDKPCQGRGICMNHYSRARDRGLSWELVASLSGDELAERLALIGPQAKKKGEPEESETEAGETVDEPEESDAIAVDEETTEALKLDGEPDPPPAPVVEPLKLEPSAGRCSACGWSVSSVSLPSRALPSDQLMAALATCFEVLEPLGPTMARASADLLSAHFAEAKPATGLRDAPVPLLATDKHGHFLRGAHP